MACKGRDMLAFSNGRIINHIKTRTTRRSITCPHQDNALGRLKWFKMLGETLLSQLKPPGMSTSALLVFQDAHYFTMRGWVLQCFSFLKCISTQRKLPSPKSRASFFPSWAVVEGQPEMRNPHHKNLQQ